MSQPRTVRRLSTRSSAGRGRSGSPTFISASTAGHELAELTAWMRHSAAGFGDDMLRVSGIGELVHLGCHDMEGFDDFTVSGASLAELTEISRRAAARGWPMSLHAVLDSTLSRVLDAWEAGARSADLAALRWSIVHADQASPRSIGPRRRRHLGRGRLRCHPGELVPALASDLVAGVRKHPRRPGQRDARHRMSLAGALTAYSAAGSYLVAEETRRGLITPGHLADFFVPTADPFTVPVDELPGIRSDWTVAGGRTTHDSGRI